MTALFAILCVVLISVIAVQIGKVSELASKIRGEAEMEERNNKSQANMMLVFMVLFLVATVISAYYYRGWMLGYGPHTSASEHGLTLDSLFNVTLFFTGIVFVATQITLFYFAWKYRADKNRKSLFLSHDNKLEVIWTIIPAIVMTYLVVGGLDAWNEVMADIPEGDIPALVPKADNEYIEIEATGYQFAWALRYPGQDGKLGRKYFTLINPATNPLGQDWEDPKNMDDFHVNEIVLPKGKKVRVRITAQDVLHNFYLPHFRVKMDAVPGMPTYFVFTPRLTTTEYRQALRDDPEYQVPDPEDPTRQLWETFDYELACAELCGKGHFSMRKEVRIVEEMEYLAWIAQQQSYYLANVRGKEVDPFRDQIFDFEIAERKAAFNTEVETARAATTVEDRTVQLDYVTFETGSANLEDVSQYELDNLVEVMEKYPNMEIEVAGHTDNVGDAEANQTLSEQRAQSVYGYLVRKGVDPARMTAAGYGQSRPLEANDTEEGREANRRVEFTITGGVPASTEVLTTGVTDAGNDSGDTDDTE